VPTVQRFGGEICGFGTTSGWRIVIGRWPDSPFGSIADAMVEDAAGWRTLIAPTVELVGYLAELYTFDATIIAPVVVERSVDALSFEGGPLQADVQVGGRGVLGWSLWAVPSRLATDPRWSALVDPIARWVLRGVRTRGRMAGGEEFYGATDRHRVVAVHAAWGGHDLGPVAAVTPPVRFGFSSTPRRPSLVAVTTTIRPADLSAGEA
jgi:hypothetical protein